MEEQKTAKVPEGMTIEKPKEEKPQSEPKQARPQRSGLDIPSFEVDPNLPTIVYPHYTNNAKTELACVLLRPDGMSVREQGIPKDENHPLYRDIKSQYSEQEIDHNTDREIQIQSKKSKAAEEQSKQQKRLDQRAQLWERKQQFLDMDIVRKTKHKELKRKLRSATNPELALAYGIAIIIKESEADEK